MIGLVWLPIQRCFFIWQPSYSYSLSCICLCCSICLRYRGCSSRASLHQLQWIGLPSPGSMQLCVHVEMHCKLPHTHTAQSKYKPKQTISTKTEPKPKPPHAHYQLLSAHTNKHVWHYQLFMFLKTCTNCRGRRVSLPLQSIAEGRPRGRRDIWAQGTED